MNKPLVEQYADKPGGPQDIFYSQPEIDTKKTFVKGRGIYLYDNQGNEYIDASSGPVTTNLGHGNPNIINAIKRQLDELSFTFPSTARNQPNIDFADKLTGLAGPGLERALFGCGGSEAMDMAIKFCRQYRYAMGEKNRTRLISCQPSYHGMNLGTLAISGDPAFADVFGDMLTMGIKIPAVLEYRNNHRNGDAQLTQDEYAMQMAGKLEQAIVEAGPETVLAFVVEPVGGSSSGAIAPPESYFNEVRRICDHYGVFLIYDEIMSGIGRTGAFLTSHLWPQARPDISVVAKGLGAGYAALGAMLAPAALVDQLAHETGFNYAYTYNANPVSCAAGLAVLNEIENQDLLSQCQQLSNLFFSRLHELQSHYKSLGDIRGRGLLIGLELVQNQASRQSYPVELNVIETFKAIAMSEGLLVYGRRSNDGRYGDSLLLAPPLTTSMQEAELILQRLEKTLARFEQHHEAS